MIDRRIHPNPHAIHTSNTKKIPPMTHNRLVISTLFACACFLNVTNAQTADNSSSVVDEQLQPQGIVEPEDQKEVIEPISRDLGGIIETRIFFDCSARTAFYYNDYLYLVGQSPFSSKTMQLYRFKYDETGKPVTQEKLLANIRTATGGHHCVSAVVYRGLVYLFYDRPLDSKYFTISYKTSSDPAQESGITEDQVWYPLGDADYDTHATGNYKTWNPYGSATTIKAVVFNDKIYLFYWDKDDGVLFKTFDGRDWSDREVVDLADYPPIEPFFIAEPVTRKGQSMLCVGGMDTQLKHMSITYMDADGNQFRGPTIKNITGRVQTNNYITSCVGSLPGEEQGNMLQILTNNVSAVDSNLVRCEVNLETGKVSPWKDTKMAVTLRQQKDYFVPVTMTTVPTLDPKAKPDDPANIRNHIVTFFKPILPAGQAVIYTEESDWFKDITPRKKDPEGNVIKPSIDTDADKTKEPECWQIIGVVEGCPPFSRNGVEGSSATASVKYGRSTKEKISYKISYDLSISLEAELGMGMVKLGGKAESTFGLANKSIHEVTRSVGTTFQNTGDNDDGKKGWLIVSKPTLESKTYRRFAQNKSKQLGKFVVVSVTDVSLSFESYDLDNPPAGMLGRKKMSDLDYWKHNNPHWADEYGGKITFHKLDAIKVDNSGGSMTPSLSLKDEQETETSTKLSFEIATALGKKKLFNIKSKSGIELEFVNSVSKTITQDVSASLLLPKNKEGPIHELTVKPGWFIPKEGVLLKDLGGKVPYWVSDGYAEANTIPWCLTWKVISSK